MGIVYVITAWAVNKATGIIVLSGVSLFLTHTHFCSMIFMRTAVAQNIMRMGAASTRLTSSWKEPRMGERTFPLSRVYQLLEPGPVVLVTTARAGRANIMTMSWHTMLDFEPPIAACVK